MKIEITPHKIQGKIYAPASKSMMLRAIAAAVLSKNTTAITNYTLCNDTETAINIAKLLGAKIEITNTKMLITSNNINKISGFNCGESALCVHLFTPLVALFSDEFTVFGENTLVKRAIDNLLYALNLLGLNSNSEKYLPVTISGNLQSGKIEIDGSAGSQTLSGLLMALPLCNGNSVIEVKNIKSKPYIDLTISVLEQFGVKIKNENYSRFFIEGNQKYQAATINIEGDWSGISCFLVAAAINGEIIFKNLNPQSLQADVVMLDVLRLCGANVNIENNNIIVKKDKLNAFDFDANDCPDLFPAIVALAANCCGTSKIKGVNRLKNKESNRAKTLQSEYAKLNIKIDLQNDEMYIVGGQIMSATVNSCNDHRIAMSLAVAAINGNGRTTIENAECVSKSYPDFWSDLREIYLVANKN